MMSAVQTKSSGVSRIDPLAGLGPGGGKREGVDAAMLLLVGERAAEGGPGRDAAAVLLVSFHDAKGQAEGAGGVGVGLSAIEREAGAVDVGQGLGLRLEDFGLHLLAERRGRLHRSAATRRIIVSGLVAISPTPASRTRRRSATTASFEPCTSSRRPRRREFARQHFLHEGILGPEFIAEKTAATS